MRYAKHTPIDKLDRLDHIEWVVRIWLASSPKCAMGAFDFYRCDLEPEDQIDLWFRFTSKERAAMKGKNANAKRT